jgi:heme exporter protein D
MHFNIRVAYDGGALCIVVAIAVTVVVVVVVVVVLVGEVQKLLNGKSAHRGK